MAVEQILMPQLGESVTEGTISKWLVAVGDLVNKYDPLAEVMTDKVNAEIPSSFEGIITEIIAKEDEALPVGSIICKIRVENEEEVQDQREVVEIENTTPIKETSIEEKVRYSPAVLSLSQKHGIQLEDVQGTGLNGRITRKDVLSFIERGKKVIKPVIPQSTVVKTIVEERPIERNIQRNSDSIPVTPIRRAIASNMVRSKHEIPHAWMMVEVDVTNLVSYRNKIKDDFKRKEGFNLTYFPFFVKAVAQALKEFPMVNASWNKEQIILHRDIHLSIAVANDHELYVPVIKHADEKSIKGIGREVVQFAQKAKTKSFTVEDLSGGTFTVNNTGAFGSISSAGIINYPQAAILQVESIVKRPVIVEDMIAVRSMVNLCLSLDHRVLDGLICGRFLARIKEILEAMNEKTISVY